jgi:hypothetical protein
LYDLEEKINKLKAFALEIEDCCFLNVKTVHLNEDPYKIENVIILI